LALRACQMKRLAASMALSVLADEVATHLLVASWLGATQTHTVTPEGLGDIDLQGLVTTNAQVKSRREARGPFSVADLRPGLSSVVEAMLANPGSYGALLLERPIASLEAAGQDRSVSSDPKLARALGPYLPATASARIKGDLLTRLRVAVVGSVAGKDQANIADRLGLPRAAGVGPYPALRARVADAADVNGARPMDSADRVTRTDAERILRDSAAELAQPGSNASALSLHLTLKRKELVSGRLRRRRRQPKVRTARGCPLAHASLGTECRQGTGV
jgi:hypothetical protein